MPDNTTKSPGRTRVPAIAEPATTSNRNRRGKPRGFTLPELLLSTVILLPVCLFTVKIMIDCIAINENARNSSLALNSSLDRMHTIENTNFSQIFSTYNNQTFTASGIDGIGVTYVDNSVAGRVTVTNSFCWKEKNQRVIGEDANLNGQLDTGEDANGNGMIDSTVQLVSVIFNT